MCRGRGRREKEENPEKAGAEVAENRKHFIHPKVRFLVCYQKACGNTREVILTLGQLVRLSCAWLAPVSAGMLRRFVV